MSIPLARKIYKILSFEVWFSHPRLWLQKFEKLYAIRWTSLSRQWRSVSSSIFEAKKNFTWSVICHMEKMIPIFIGICKGKNFVGLRCWRCCWDVDGVYAVLELLDVEESLFVQEARDWDSPIWISCWIDYYHQTTLRRWQLRESPLESLLKHFFPKWL